MKYLKIATAACLMHAVSPAAVSAQTDRQALALVDLQPAAATSLVPNASFVPLAGTAAAPAFHGTLRVQESRMAATPETFKSGEVFGKNPMIFPAFELSFTTADGDLIPVTQDVVRVGSLPGGESFWDILVQPGRVWKEEGDGDWSRASFPFALMHSLEGETHNGVAMFLYRNGEVSGLRY